MTAQATPKKQHPFYKRPLPIITIIGSLVFAAWFVFGKNGLWDTYRFRKKQEQNAVQIALMKDQIKFLEQQLDDLKKKDPLALEAAARNYGLVAADEKIYTIEVAGEASKP